jgi:hypothetical protein
MQDSRLTYGGAAAKGFFTQVYAQTAEEIL